MRRKRSASSLGVLQISLAIVSIANHWDSHADRSRLPHRRAAKRTSSRVMGSFIWPGADSVPALLQFVRTYRFRIIMATLTPNEVTLDLIGGRGATR